MAPAAELARARRPPGEPRRRLGYAVRHADRAPARSRRDRGRPRALGRRPQRLLPAARAQVRRGPGFADRSRPGSWHCSRATRRRCGCGTCSSRRARTYFLAVYDPLGVMLTSEDFFGESFYNPMLAPVVDELDALGLLRESDGREGASSRPASPAGTASRCRSSCANATAATGTARPTWPRSGTGPKISRRPGCCTWSARRSISTWRWCTQTAREAGWLAPPARATHVGVRLGPRYRRQEIRVPGRRHRSSSPRCSTRRSPGPSAIVTEKNPDLDDATPDGGGEGGRYRRDQVRGPVQRLDQGLRVRRGTGCSATTGDTAAYLQYTYARIQSIFRKGGVMPGGDRGAVRVTEPAEHALALALLGFPAVIADVAETLQFHKLTVYLQSLAGAYTTFYEPVPGAEGRRRDAGEPARAVRPDRPRDHAGPGSAGHHDAGADVDLSRS